MACSPKLSVGRIKSDHGMRCDLRSPGLLLLAPFYPSSQVEHLRQLATSMLRQTFLGVPSYLVHRSVNPRLQDTTLHVLHVSMRDLFGSIQNILVGNSSSLYQWDSLLETFVLPPTADGKRVFIVVEGKDDALMQRYT